MLPSGSGVFQKQVDRLWDYLPRRRRFYGFDLCPLPQSLGLSEQDAALNRNAKLRVQPVVEGVA